MSQRTQMLSAKIAARSTQNTDSERSPFDTMERRRPMSSSSTSLSHLKSQGQTVNNPLDGAAGHREKPNDRNAANGRFGKAAIEQARLSRMLRLNSRRISGVNRSSLAARAKAGDAFDRGPSFLLTRHRTLQCTGHAICPQFPYP